MTELTEPMGASEGSRTDQASGAAPVTTGEQALLDEAMVQADQRLVASLQRDELRRRRRRRWLLGGIAMSVMTLAIIGSLLLSGPATQPVDAGKPTEADLDKAAALSTAGWELWKQQIYVEAAEKFQQAVKLDPQSENAWNGLGWSRFNSGDSVEAEKAFEQCVKLNSSHGAAINGLGQVYLFRRQYDKAEKPLLQAAELNASAAWYGLTRMYLLQGKYDQAVKWAEKVVKSQPDDEMAKKMLAAAKDKKLDPALRRQIEPPDPNEQSPETRRGWQFFQRQDYRRGIEAFREALKKDPNQAHAHNGLGFCLLNSGKAAEAKSHFQTCLKLMPEHLGAMNGLARCLMEGEKDLDGAIALWEKMDQLAPGPSAATAGLAHAYLQKGEPEKAIKYFEILLKANPDDADAKQGLDQARQALAEAKK